jgi:hypothetical protein
MAVMSGAFGLAGYYFGNILNPISYRMQTSIDIPIGRNPTSATSESKVSIAAGSMPWQSDRNEGGAASKYQYHPGGNPKNAPKDAPSALNTVIVPNVNLPKVRNIPV